MNRSLPQNTVELLLIAVVVFGFVFGFFPYKYAVVMLLGFIAANTLIDQ